MNDDCGECQAGPSKGPTRYQDFKNKIKRWIFLNIWCRHLSRRVNKLLHKCNLHYMTPSPMNPPFGKQEYWCQWCGMRGTNFKYDPDKGLEQ